MVQILLWPNRNVRSMKMTSIERIEKSQMINGEDLIKSSKVFKWENVKSAG
jgi:hypothetical protein